MLCFCAAHDETSCLAFLKALNISCLFIIFQHLIIFITIQLQHFDARNNNPVPPFQYNILGNGSAHPIFEPDQIAVDTQVNSGMVNDDAYMLNNLFFDDWFVSSIAPDLSDFTGSEDRSLEEVYEDHVNGVTPLPNRFYVPTNCLLYTSPSPRDRG